MVEIVPKQVRIFCYAQPTPDTIISFGALVIARVVENITFKLTKLGDGKSTPVLYVFAKDAAAIAYFEEGVKLGECFELDKKIFEKGVDKLVEDRLNERAVEEVFKRGGAAK